MSSRSLEAGGDTSNNRSLSDFKVLPEQRGVGPRVQRPECPGLPEANKPGEQLWRPVLPKDQEKIKAFVNDLAQNKEQVLGQLESFLSKPNKTRDDVALAIYLDAVVKRDVLGIDPFASYQPGGEAHQESREYIAVLATEHVAKAWLEEHPDSQLAELVADMSIYAPDFMHRTFCMRYGLQCALRLQKRTDSTTKRCYKDHVHHPAHRKSFTDGLIQTRKAKYRHFPI
jgi:hypothetical protein